LGQTCASWGRTFCVYHNIFDQQSPNQVAAHFHPNKKMSDAEEVKITYPKTANKGVVLRRWLPNSRKIDRDTVIPVKTR
jgi:hypothetical protein